MIQSFEAKQRVPAGRISILGSHSIGHSKKENLYEHVSYSERCPIFGEQYFEFRARYFPSLLLYEQSQQPTDASHRFMLETLARYDAREGNYCTPNSKYCHQIS
jgi:hypothetical protein